MADSGLAVVPSKWAVDYEKIKAYRDMPSLHVRQDAHNNELEGHFGRKSEKFKGFTLYNLKHGIRDAFQSLD